MSEVLSSINIQLLTKALSFGINLGVARCIDPAAFGTAQISFGLLETLSLSLLKDGFRRTALRTSNDGSKDSQKDPVGQQSTQSSINVAYLGVLCSFFIIALLGFIWAFYFEPPSTIVDSTILSSSFSDTTLWYRLSIGLVCTGILLQTLVEPAVTRCLLQQSVTQRIKIEGFATVARSITPPLVLIGASKLLGPLTHSEQLSIGLLSFAVGHVSSGLVWLLAFPTSKAHPTANLSSIKQLKDHTFLSEHHRELLPSLLILACEKVLLNEVERLVLFFLFSSDVWALYAVVFNLGSLVCRLIFAPIEEVAAVAFSAGGRSTDVGRPYVEIGKDATEDDEDRGEDKLQLSLLGLYMGCEGWIGLSVAVLGPPVSGALLFFLYGSKWVARGSHWILQRYCIHLFAMSINGTLEAYMYSRGSPTWLSSLKWIHASIWFGGVASIIGLKFFASRFFWDGESRIAAVVLDASSLIFGNLLSVALRILIGLYFVVGEIRVSAASRAPSQPLRKLRSGIFLTPLFTTIAAGIGLRLAIRFLLSNGVESILASALMEGGSAADVQQLLEAAAASGAVKSLLLKELLLAAIAGLITVGCFAYSFLHSNAMKKRKIT